MEWLKKMGGGYVRKRFREYPGGPRHAAWRECAKNATDAKEVRKALEKELEEEGPESLLHNRDTWGALADYYRDNYLVEAQYLDGKKVSGRRSWKVARYQLQTLRSLIPDLTKLRQMDYEFCRLVRQRLIALPVTQMVWTSGKVMRRGKEVEVKRALKVEVQRSRSAIDVNRTMELFRHTMKVARKRLRWIKHDPFADAEEPLIVQSDEKKRRRIMSFEEEDALLECCVDEWVIGRTTNRPYLKTERAHVRIVILGLVDTLMRSGEFFKLRDTDANFDLRAATVQQMNTKTLCERAAPISGRFALELRSWLDLHPPEPGGRVFPFNSIRTAWKGVKQAAGVTNLRLKDLRRTGATRLLRNGMPIEEISLILGHTSVEMTYDYIGVDKDTTGRAVSILDAMHEARERPDVVVH